MQKMKEMNECEWNRDTHGMKRFTEHLQLVIHDLPEPNSTIITKKKNEIEVF